MHEVFDVRAVELDRAVHQIVEARRAVGHAETDRRAARLSRSRAAISVGVSAQQARSYRHAPRLLPPLRASP